ncbi:MAG: hypothetical protein M1831_004870 [Alyxoria varia]|nr:MAG: hypothetical protein M1831_004870 [Alyxoria varia]
MVLLSSTAMRLSLALVLSALFLLSNAEQVAPRAVPPAAAAPAVPAPAAPAVPAPAAAPTEQGQYNVAYTKQTGATRYAPMQPIPKTKITATQTKPLYPTSAVGKIAKGYLGKPKHSTTLTQSQTHSVKSTENKATPLPQPDDDMQKFLARWKD